MKNKIFRNVTGKIKDSQCIKSLDGGCLDKDFDFHPYSEIDQRDGTEIKTSVTTTTNNTPQINAGKIASSALLIGGLGTLGAVAGIIVAIKRKSGFWGGVGWFFLLGIAGNGVGYVIASTKNYSK